jgi:hypothetical protein
VPADFVDSIPVLVIVAPVVPAFHMLQVMVLLVAFDGVIVPVRVRVVPAVVVVGMPEMLVTGMCCIIVVLKSRDHFLFVAVVVLHPLVFVAPGFAIMNNLAAPIEATIGSEANKLFNAVPDRLLVLQSR